MFNNLFSTVIISYCDAAESWQLGTQDPATPIMEGMISFHNYLVFYIIFIGIAVC
jgi:cytochrome c oxidase subunit 2